VPPLAGERRFRRKSGWRRRRVPFAEACDPNGPLQLIQRAMAFIVKLYREITEENGRRPHPCHPELCLAVSRSARVAEIDEGLPAR
jgi:hypothetical protein